MLKNLVKDLKPSSTLAINETSKQLEQQGKKIFKFGYEFSKEPEKTLQRALAILKSREGLASGDKVAIISDVLAEGNSDAIQLRHLD